METHRAILRGGLQGMEGCGNFALSSASREQMLRKYPRARTWEAPSWREMDRMWNFDCTEYHYHHGEHPLGAAHLSNPSPLPSAAPPPYASPKRSGRPPSSSSAPSPRTSPIKASQTALALLPTSPPASPTKGAPSSASAPISRSTSAAPSSPTKGSRNGLKLGKDELAYLAAFRPRPGPISLQRLNQQFARVLGPRAVAPPSVLQDTAARTGAATPADTPDVPVAAGALRRSDGASKAASAGPSKPLQDGRDVRVRVRNRGGDATEVRVRARNRGEHPTKVHVHVHSPRAVVYIEDRRTTRAASPAPVDEEDEGVHWLSEGLRNGMNL
ncbi:hypothetical protein DFH06DRAFT_1147074 [Mycena polygramma]|nr:hypothetical protein DFH06DRAFT_1147074 [Mycena polygramma]